ncbi:MAG: Heavy-metal-associated domain [Bacteroidota bacterium]|jgi:Cu+-exporting ATPase
MKEIAELEVSGMNCGHCSSSVQVLIEEVEGVYSASVELSSALARVEFDGHKTSIQSIIENINSSNIYKAIKK